MLLDTHVALWLVSDDAKLGPAARNLIRSAGTVHVSVVSMWEIAIKTGAGKLVVPDDLPERVSQAGLEWLPLTVEHAWASRRTPDLPQRDPFDRLLVTQARDEGLAFVTADRAILGAETDGLVTVDARA